MQQYVALLRGINVSGKNKIKMVDLKNFFEEFGCISVGTYIQSGNVVFTSERDVDDLEPNIEATIFKHFKMEVPVLIRREDEIASIRNNSAVADMDLATEGSRVVISFLQGEPDSEDLQSLHQFIKYPEILVTEGRESYLHCPQGYSKTKLSNTLLERKLGMNVTTRNLKTVDKILRMFSAVKL